MKGIEAAFSDRVGQALNMLMSKAGKCWARLSVAVDGTDADGSTWVSVGVFGEAAEAAATLKAGDRCYVEGVCSSRAGPGRSARRAQA